VGKFGGCVCCSDIVPRVIKIPHKHHKTAPVLYYKIEALILLQAKRSSLEKVLKVNSNYGWILVKQVRSKSTVSQKRGLKLWVYVKWVKL
jgi:hypothetical protein